MSEIPVTLPPESVPETSIDEGHLAELVLQALHRTASSLDRCTPKQKSMIVYRPTGSEATGHMVSVPHARTEPVFDALRRAWKAGCAAGVTDYLWDHGCCRRTITGDRPGKEAWAGVIAQEYIGFRLMRWLEDSAIEPYITGSESDRDGSFRKMARDFAHSFVSRTNRIRVTFFPSIIQLSGATDLKVGETSFTALDPVRQSRYLTRFSSRLGDTLPFWLAESVAAEIEFEIPMDLGLPDISTLAGDHIDSLWVALAMGNKKILGCSIGPVMVEITALSGGTSLMIVDRTSPRSVFSVVSLTADYAKATVERLQSLSVALRQLDRVPVAVWRFGRACAASSNADRLAESVIGLESLLVGSPGESTYRFKLHGTVLLSSRSPEKPEDLFTKLGLMYSARASYLHGMDTGTAEELAASALLHLQLAIEAVVDLQAKGMLTGKKVTPGIERLVRDWSVKGSKDIS